MKQSRLLLSVCLAVVVAASAPLLAQTYPDRAVVFIVPQSPGGANDTIARIITQKLSAILKQPMVIDNRPGAGGNIGTALVTKAKPDGYTLLFTTNSAQVINPSLYKYTGFDAVKDFEPIGTAATAGYVLVANPAFPPQTVAELIEHVKRAPPNSIPYASAGNGTLNHLGMVMLEKAAGIQMQHIPYKAAAAAATDVVGGQVPLALQSLPSSLGFIKTGKLKVLGTLNEKRSAALPDTPTIGEAIPGFGATPWYGVLAPAGTPRPVIERMQAAIAEALDAIERADPGRMPACYLMRGVISSRKSAVCRLRKSTSAGNAPPAAA